MSPIILPFQNNKFKTIYIDPPWPEYGGGKIVRGAQEHYPLMKVEEIKDLKSEINRVADENCHLYLWSTNSFLPQAFDIVDYWGFKYITTITWMKNRIGIGQYYRGLTEHCIFSRRGSLPYRIKEDRKRAQGATGFIESKTLHSVKPHKMREMIETVSYPPRLELFAREKVSGWESWGNEI